MYQKCMKQVDFKFQIKSFPTITTYQKVYDIGRLQILNQILPYTQHTNTTKYTSRLVFTQNKIYAHLHISIEAPRLNVVPTQANHLEISYIYVLYSHALYLSIQSTRAILQVCLSPLKERQCQRLVRQDQQTYRVGEGYNYKCTMQIESQLYKITYLGNFIYIFIYNIISYKRFYCQKEVKKINNQTNHKNKNKQMTIVFIFTMSKIFFSTSRIKI
eukprot:TRINITY_DN10449_c0_g1_i5.p1 TRINITY_DN10449_c0_g1~~TRINITY_DN10449_c0_g1_i5.p1  ORF type:complete len:216 (+),score=-32.05 TRINITY_DN10449_c0_g1_i5:710-1357(+)